MARRRRKFTAEFKIDAVRLAERGKSPGVVARELGIRADMLRRWRRQFATSARPGASTHDAFPSSGKLTSQDEEARQLRRRVAQFEEEREILKKAAAFFSRGDSRSSTVPQSSGSGHAEARAEWT